MRVLIKLIPLRSIVLLLKYIRYFIVIAESESLSGAARILNVGQSALSQVIARLEKRYGTSLLRRSAQGITLSDAGIAMYEYCKGVSGECRKLDEGMAAFRNEERPCLTIGIMSLHEKSFIPTIAAEFSKRYPLVRMDFIVGSAVELMELLADSQLDACVVNLPLPPHFFFVSKLFDEYPIAAIPSDHPALMNTNRGSQDKEIPFAILRDCEFIIPSGAESFVMNCERLFDKAGFRPTKITSMVNLETITSLVENSMGIGLLPSSFVKGQQTNTAGVTYRRIKGAKRIPVTVVFRKHQPIQISYVRGFIRIAKNSSNN